MLAEFGFAHCYVHERPGNFDELIIEAGRRALADAAVSLDDIGALVLVSGLGHSPVAATGTAEPLGLFRYPAARAHYELGLTKASAFAVSQQGCSGLLSAVDMAARLVRSADAPAVLCLAGDALPAEANREIMYNLMSDAAAALLLERGAAKNRVVAFHQQTQSYYWDTPRREQELLGAYFPMARRVILGCLDRAGLEPAAVRWFVPHNVSLRSWQILARLLAIPEEKVWTRNIGRVGHTVSCDHVINLADMEVDGALAPGDYLVLFTFGFGASWSCLVLQH